MKFKSSEEAFKYIESFTNLEKTPNLTAREYRLDRMFSLLEIFDQPQMAFKSIHVAGSKGKGSTSAFIAAALKANGYKTGLYSSPHVETYKERINAAGVFFEDRLYLETAEDMFTTIGDRIEGKELPGGPPTTFELLTLLAFLIFKKAGCEWAVFETGLGGRLDATNVLIPEASVLTIIELEHTEYLGNTITEIAGEKAGIIKKGVPVYSAYQKEEAEEVFRKRAKTSGSALYFPDDLIKSISAIDTESEFRQSFSLVYKDGQSFKVNLKSAGDFQIKNASLAVSVLKNIMPASFDPVKGIGEMMLPGRMEIMVHEESRLPLLLDGAHTVESIRSAVKAFHEIAESDFHGSTLIFGAVSGKDIEGMAALLGEFSRIIISKPGSFKPNDPNKVYSVFKKLYPASPSIELITDAESALSQAIESEFPILVTGSFFMLAEIRRLLV